MIENILPTPEFLTAIPFMTRDHMAQRIEGHGWQQMVTFDGQGPVMSISGIRIAGACCTCHVPIPAMLDDNHAKAMQDFYYVIGHTMLANGHGGSA